MAYTMSGEFILCGINRLGISRIYALDAGSLCLGQLFIAPLSCYFLARTGNVAPGLFIAMGGSAMLIANPMESPNFQRQSVGLLLYFVLPFSTNATGFEK